MPPDQVIGGGHIDTQRPPAHVLEQIVGPPRLPQELVIQIILMAADEVIEQSPHSLQTSTSLLQLAAISRPAYGAIVAGKILPDLHLTGVRQVQSFANALRINALDLRKDARRIRRLTIKRVSSVIGNPGLYSDVEETKQFERTTIAPLRIILAHCRGLEHLSLDMPARVFDPRNEGSKEKSSAHSATTQLRELITLLSLYGGDLNERLWETTPMHSPPLALAPPSRWSHLTHLQLHGPRFRMTALTAISLSQLPALTHLALIMPWVVLSMGGGNESALFAGPTREHERRLDEATDALGRRSVWQLLVDGLADRLRVLQLVCHDIDGYVGSVQKLGPWFRALRWRYSKKGANLRATDSAELAPSGVESLQQRAPHLILVTASATWEGQQAQEVPHPSCFSRWMLRRAERQRHWTFEDGESDAIGNLAIQVSVEAWKASLALDVPFSGFGSNTNGLSNPDLNGEGLEPASHSTTQRWMTLDADDARDGEDDMHGVDALA